MPGAAGIGARPDDDLHVLIERRQERHQAFDRELIEPVVFQGRDFRLRDTQQRRDFPLFQLAALQQFIDGQGQARLGLPFGGICVAQVGEDVGGAAGDLAHGASFVSQPMLLTLAGPHSTNVPDPADLGAFNDRRMKGY